MRLRYTKAGVLAAWLVVLALTGCTREPVATPDDRLEAAGEAATRLLVESRRATAAGRYALALGLVDSLIRHVPELPEAHYHRGHIMMQLYQLEEADEAFRQTASLDPYHRGAFYKRGHVAFEQARFRDAIDWYHRQREIVEASPEELRTYYRRQDTTVLSQSWLQVGRSYQLLHVTDSARLAYEQVLSMDGDHVQASVWLAEVFDEEGDVEAALPHARRAWRHQRGNPEVAYQLATLLLKSGDPEQALPLFEQVVEVQPWNAGAHYNLGRLLVSQGRDEEGRRHLALTDRLQDLDQEVDQAYAAAARLPDDPTRWQKLANLLAQAGRREEQQRALRVVHSLSASVPVDSSFHHDD